MSHKRAEEPPPLPPPAPPPPPGPPVVMPYAPKHNRLLEWPGDLEIPWVALPLTLTVVAVLATLASDARLGCWLAAPAACIAIVGALWRRTHLWLALIALAMCVVPVYAQVRQTRAHGVFRAMRHCAANLHSIGLSVVLYMSAHGDQMPPDLQAIVDARYISESLLQCPGADSGRACDYFYLPAASTAPRDTMVACDLRGSHSQRHGRNVLFLAGYTQWMTEPDFQAELSKPQNVAFAAALCGAESTP